MKEKLGRLKHAVEGHEGRSLRWQNFIGKRRGRGRENPEFRGLLKKKRRTGELLIFGKTGRTRKYLLGGSRNRHGVACKTGEGRGASEDTSLV